MRARNELLPPVVQGPVRRPYRNAVRGDDGRTCPIAADAIAADAIARSGRRRPAPDAIGIRRISRVLIGRSVRPCSLRAIDRKGVGIGDRKNDIVTN